MKKKKIALLFTIPFLLASCGSEEDDLVKKYSHYGPDGSLLLYCEYSYDNGSTIIDNYEPDTQFVLKERFKTEVENNLTIETYERYSEQEGKWHVVENTTKEFDYQNKPIIEHITVYNDDNKVIEFTTKNYIYSKDNIVTVQETKFNYANNRENYRETVYEYNSLNHLVKETLYFLESDGLKLTDYTDFSYDNQGRLIEEARHTSYYGCDWITTTTYEKRKIIKKHFGYDEEGGAPIENSRDEFILDSKERVVKHNFMYTDGDVFTLQHYETYEY